MNQRVFRPWALFSRCAVARQRQAARYGSLLGRWAVCCALTVGLAALAPAAERPSYVIQISVDGLHAGFLQDMLSQGKLPTFQRLVLEGATTFNARTDVSHTNTLPNHTCMLLSRPVLATPGKRDIPFHGWTDNRTPDDDETLHGKLKHRGKKKWEYRCSVFDVVHDHGLRTGLFANKKKFVLYRQSYDQDAGANDVTGADNGRGKIDVVHISNKRTGAEIHDLFLANLSSNPPHYSFLHYRDPDTSGHKHGWGSGPWRASIERVDRYLSDVLAVIESNQNLRGRTAIILSTDHGGVGTNHRDANSPENFTIPFMVWGAGVASGVDLYELNQETRKDPGTTNPAFDVWPQPIRNGDGGNLALSLLGLHAIPGSYINARQDLVVSLD